MSVMDALGRDWDTRPKLNGWAPGGYIKACRRCGESFVGDKRASSCAPCAYKDTMRGSNA